MLNNAQKIAKNISKYGWRYEAFDKWLLTHAAPPAEKSTFTQLKKRTLAFGEKLARRLRDEYGIPGIFTDGANKNPGSSGSSPKELQLLEVFSNLSEDQKDLVMGHAELLLKLKNSKNASNFEDAKEVETADFAPKPIKIKTNAPN